MKGVRKRATLVGVVVAILVVGLLVAWRHEVIRFALAHGIGLATGYTVDITQERFGFSHGALEGVSVSKDGEPVLAARRIDISYSLRDLLPGSTHRYGLVGITIDRPFITIVRHKDGGYNIRLPEAAAPPPTVPGPVNRVPFNLSVRIRDAAGELRAPYALDPSARRLRIAHVSFDATINTAARTHYTLNGAFAEPRNQQPFTALGTIDVPRGYAIHHAYAAAVPMRAIANYFINSDAARILGGTAREFDLRLYALDVQPFVPITYHVGGSLEVRDGEMQIVGLAQPMTQINGRLQLVDDTLFARDLHARLADVPVRVAGGIFAFDQPQFRLGVSGSGDLARLRNALWFARNQDVKGQADISLLVEGDLATPTLVVRANAAHASYRGIPLAHVRASVALHDAYVYLAPVIADAQGASLEARGTMTLGDTLHSQLVVHASAPADRFPYAGELLGNEGIVADASLDGENGLFHVRGALASVRGTQRAAAVFTLERNGLIDLAPMWIHTERGDLDARYQLDRAHDTSAFWLLARGFALRAPQHASFLDTALPALPPIDAHVDEVALAGGGPSGARANLAGRLRVHDARVAGVTIDRAQAQFAGTLAGSTIDHLRLEGPWGTLDGNGAFSTRALVMRGAYRGTLQGLRPFLAGQPAQGAIDGTASLAIMPQMIEVQGQDVHLHDASVRGIPITQLNGTIALQNGVLRVYSARAQLAGGDVVAAGSYGTSSSISLVANALDAAHLRGIGLPLDAGSVAADGRFGQGAPLPSFQGVVSVGNGRVQHYAVAGSGEVATQGDGAHLSHVVGAIDHTYGIGEGSLGALTSGAPTYAFQANVPAGDVATALHTLSLPTFNSEGTFNGTFDVRGSGLEPTLSGPINVPAGSLNGLGIVDARAQLTADRAGVIVRRGSLLVGTTQVGFAAGDRPRISGVRVTAPRADLSDFNNFFDTGDTLDGNGSLRFDVISQQHRISSNGSVNVRGFRYRNLPIGDTRASWSSSRNTLQGTLAVGGDEGLLTARGTIGLLPAAQWQSVLLGSHYDVNLDLSNLDLSLWVAALGFPQVPITGRVDANGSVRGSYPRVDLRGTARLNHGTIWRFPIDAFDLAFRSDRGRVLLDHSLLQAPGIRASGTGNFGLRPDDALNLDVHASSNDLPTFVAQLTRERVPITGDFETTVHVGGTYRAPAFSAAFDASDVDAYGVKISSLFGSLRLHGRAIELRNAGATLARGDVSIAGTLPLELQPFGVGPARAPVSFDLGVNNLDPAVFDGLIGQHTQLGGTIDGLLNLSGTVGEPRIYGRFGVREGSYVSDLEHTPITGIQTTLTFDRTQASVDRLFARLGSGALEGTGHISFPHGFASLSGTGATFDVRASARGAQLDFPNYGRGTLEGELALMRGANDRASLSGDVTLDNGTIPFAAFLAATEQNGGVLGSGGTPLDLGFNLKMKAGKNVRVRGAGYGAGLDIGATGGAVLGGTMASPTLDGGFTSTGGTLTYFDRAFKVQQGTVSFTPAEGIVPTLHAIGTTHVINPDPDLSRNPYGSADITINVDGPVDGLKVGFTSNPPGYTREQIIALIAPFGGFLNGIQFSPAYANQTTNGALGALQPLPGISGGSQAGTITVGQEAFNILNAQFTAGLLSPLESALSQGLGFSDINLTVDYYGNVGFSARRFLGKEVSFVYATTFGLPTRQSFGLELAPNEATSAQLSVFFQNGPLKLFQTPTGAFSSNTRLTLGESLQGQSGFSFTLQRSFW